MMDNFFQNPISLFFLCLVCSFSRQTFALTKYYVENRCTPSTSYPITYDIDSPFLEESSSAIFKSSQYGGYKGGLNCTIRLHSSGDGIILTVEKIDFRAFCVDSIKIENSYGIQLGYLCGNEYIPMDGKSYYTSGDMTIRYKTGSGYVSSLYDGFRILATSYRTTPCYSGVFECNNAKCIYNGFVCDGHNHCGDNSDQDNCVGRLRVGSFVGLFVSIFITVGLIIGVAACIRRRRRRVTVGTIMTSPAAAVPPPPYGAQYPAPQFATQYAPPPQQISPSAYQGVNQGYQTEHVNPLYK